MSRELFAEAALSQIPKILTLLDRNPHSPTYGCFDRNFWHYRIIDFPSGMSQEFVLPLALAYQLDIPGNRFHQQQALRDWVEAGIAYAARSAHPDGSCDDYFPYERASGAAAFSLVACVESYRLLGFNSDEALRFFERRADALAAQHESGRLSNHHALIALGLELTGRLLETDQWKNARDERIEQVLSWQDPEGWFHEYEGCDPGYHTLTLSSLAHLYDLTGDQRLKQPIARAVEIAAELIHPDGSFGGEYGSRNTYNFFPHGFELAGRWIPEALAVNDRFLNGLANGREATFSDDHIIGHHTWNYLQAWRDFNNDRPATLNQRRRRVELKSAGIIIDRRDGNELYIGVRKGGVFKLFRDDKLIASDTQVSLRVRSAGAFRNAVAHLIGDHQLDSNDNSIEIRGRFGWAKQAQMSTFRLIALRIVMLSVGRFFPDLIRKRLQTMLITGNTPAPFSFSRTFFWEGSWKVIDEVQADSWEQVDAAGIGCDQTSIYVVMSRTFQAGQLQPWLDLSERIRALKPGEPLVVERVFGNQ